MPKRAEVRTDGKCTVCGLDARYRMISPQCDLCAVKSVIYNLEEYMTTSELARALAPYRCAVAVTVVDGSEMTIWVSEGVSADDTPIEPVSLTIPGTGSYCNDTRAMWTLAELFAAQHGARFVYHQGGDSEPNPFAIDLSILLGRIDSAVRDAEELAKRFALAEETEEGDIPHSDDVTAVVHGIRCAAEEVRTGEALRIPSIPIDYDLSLIHI